MLRFSIAQAGQSVEKQAPLKSHWGGNKQAQLIYKVMWQNFNRLAHQSSHQEFTQGIYLHKDLSVYVKGCLNQHYLWQENINKKTPKCPKSKIKEDKNDQKFVELQLG